MNEVKVIDTDNHKKHGENRCPECNASDVTLDIKKGKLVCNYCGHEFDPKEAEGIEKEAKNLYGEKHGSGTKDIKYDNDVITLKCGGCGAEVVINTKESNNARCHWCRSILSINSQIDNGAVPDLVLPFKIDKEEAKKKISDYVDKKKFYAHPTFKKEFTTNNIMGVYFPYLLVDCNGHATFAGDAGHVARSYTKVVGKDKDGNEEKETFYDIDIYKVKREFNIAIDDLQVESSKDKLNKDRKDKTTNIINSIMPFDTENTVKYESNYLEGFTSEKRDINVSSIDDKINQSLVDIARHSINNDLKYYDAGVHWEQEQLDIKGRQVLSAYLPVWLYSYQDKKKTLHYVAVNARTGETMGSIPMNKIKLFIISISIFIGLVLLPFIINYIMYRNLKYYQSAIPAAIFTGFIGLIISLVVFFVIASGYRNKGARHKYESETKNEITNLIKEDKKIRTDYEESFSTISGVNNRKIIGEYTGVKEEQ